MKSSGLEKYIKSRRQKKTKVEDKIIKGKITQFLKDIINDLKIFDTRKIQLHRKSKSNGS